MSVPAPRVLLVPEWVERFKTEASSAQRSIYLQSLNFESGQLVDSLVPILLSAAKRGVQVVLHIDWVAQHYVHGTIKLLPRTNVAEKKYAQRIWERNARHVAALRAAGCEFRYTNQFTWWQQFLKISGRNHQKVYVVDEQVAWIGGVNLLDVSLKSLDVMLEFRDAKSIAAIVGAFQGVDASRPRSDYAVTLPDTQGELLVDAGRRGQSLIYERTVALAQQAEKQIILISQFVPEGALRRVLLEKARSGIPVTFLTSPITDRKFRTWPYQPMYKTFVWETAGAQNFEALHLPQHVHAKVILIDDYEVLVGSHNLVETGVKLGTQEVAYRTTQPEVVQWFSTWLKNLAHAA